MMLSERIEITESGFLIKPNGDADTEAFYGFFSLKDSLGATIHMKKVRYWEPLDAHIEKIDKPQTYIRVEERKNSEVVESYEFYFQRAKRHNALSISVRPERRYGKGAYLITIEWEQGRGEAINSDYIWLCGKNKKRFHFMRDLITPLKPDAKRPLDQYVYIVPENENPADYYVEVHPLVRKRYQVTYR